MSLHASDSGGSGRAVVFLHGFLESSAMWSHLSLDKLELRSIFIDLPGHGQSEKCELLPPGIDVFARLVMQTLDKLDVNSFDLVGHSMGGYVALALKRSDPRVGKVVLLNSNTWADPAEKKKDRRRVAELVYRTKDFFLRESIPNLFRQPASNRVEIDKLITDAKRMEPDAIAYAALAMADRPDFTGLVFDNEADFLIIQGEDDNIVPAALMNSIFFGKLTNYVVINEAGHMAHIEKPAAVLKAMCNFLQKEREV